MLFIPPPFLLLGIEFTVKRSEDSLFVLSHQDLCVDNTIYVVLILLSAAVIAIARKLE